MADEQSLRPHNVTFVAPAGYGWSDLLDRSGFALETYYRHTLEELGKQAGMLGLKFREALNQIRHPAKPQRLIVNLIDREPWTSLSIDVKGEAYEGLLKRTLRS